MHTPFTAPAPQGNYPTREKRDDIQLVPMGGQPAIIYAMINTGTHEEQFKNESPKMINKIKIKYEFPFHRQLFYKDDTEPTPSVLTQSYTYTISKNKKSGKKSNLLLLLEGLFGPIPESNYLTFDLSVLLNLKVMATVQHYQKTDGSLGAKITNVAPLNPQFVDPNTMIRKNELMIYNVQMGFDTPYFAKLHYYDRETLKKSAEGIKHAQAGGRFVKTDDNGMVVIDDSAVPVAAQPNTRTVSMLNGLDYNAHKQVGWTDEALVANGLAVWQQAAPVAAPAPVQQLPPAAAYQAPQQAYQQPAPVQQAAQVPAQTPVQQMPQQALPQQAAPVQQLLSAPQAPTPTVVMTAAANGVSLEAFQAQGWTVDALVANGYATLQPAPMPTAPQPIPQQPAAAPPAVQQPMQAAPQPMAQPVPQAQPMPAPAIAQPMPAVAQPAPAVAQPAPVAAPPQEPTSLFTNTPAAPVQQVAPQVAQPAAAPVQQMQPAPIAQPMAMPQQPVQPMTQFETPGGSNFQHDEEHDDLPF